MPRPPGKKLPPGEREQYILTLYRMLLNGYSWVDIHQHASAMRKKSKSKSFKGLDWNLADRTIDEYLSEAKKLLYAKSSETMDEYLEEAKKRLDDLYKDAIEAGDKAEARKVLLAKNKILGYEKMTVEHSGTVTIKDLNKLLDKWGDK